MSGWRSRLGLPGLTVAIPLHGAGAWLDVVSANLESVPATARVVLSDRSRRDDAHRRLRRRHAGDRRLRFVEATDDPGWRGHVNQLIAACRTPLFTVLPQDDSVPPGYFELLVEALATRPTAGLAFGRIRAVGLGETEHELPGPPCELGLRPPWQEAIRLDREWNLGIPWRGVVRRRHLRPILPTSGDRFADQIWVFGIALEAHLVEVPEAVYLKRYHGGNTHGRWPALEGEERRAVKEREIRRRLGRRPEEREAALVALAGKAGGQP